ncbi:MAG: tRNA (N6-threonylcarbamoyladenosine(37)-N6)-methyltransferase TrmO [Gemmatimonadota bacterium]
MTERRRYEIHPIGVVRSELRRREDAPRQGWLGAPAAWLELDERYRDGLLGIEPGSELVVVTWLHLSDRDVLQVHPRGDDDAPRRGVFSTRAPVRPNPLGLHTVTVLEVDGTRLRVEPLEAVDGTPVVDLKASFTDRDRTATSA